MTVLGQLVARAARLLDASFEAEIVELHHHAKKDAPSGTALALGRRHRGRARRRRRAGAPGAGARGDVGPRAPGEIGIRCAGATPSATTPSSSAASASGSS